MLRKEELQEIGTALTHQNHDAQMIEGYRKLLEDKKLSEADLRKHEADDNYNAPAAERSAKQTMILENKLFPNIPLARYFIVPIWNTFSELFSAKRIATNSFKILLSLIVIAGCITAVAFFPPLVAVFIANTFFSLPSLLTLVGIATVTLYAGNIVATFIENYAHKHHWNRYECTHLQEQHFEKCYDIKKETSQKIKAYLVNKNRVTFSLTIQKITENLLEVLRISDEKALNDLTVFFIEELKVLKNSKPDMSNSEAYHKWIKDTNWVLEIVAKLNLASNLNPKTRAALKKYEGRQKVQDWFKEVETLTSNLEGFLSNPIANQTQIKDCQTQLKTEFKKIKIKEKPNNPTVNLKVKKYNKFDLRKKEYEKVHSAMSKLMSSYSSREPTQLAELSELDLFFKKRLKV